MAKKKYEKVTSITTADEYGNAKTIKLTGNTGGYTRETTPALSAVGNKTSKVQDVRTIKNENTQQNGIKDNDFRTIKTEDTQKNLKDAENKLNLKTAERQKKEAEIYEKVGQSFNTKFENPQEQTLTYDTKGIKKTALPEQKITPNEARKQLTKELGEEKEAYDQWKIANYENNMAKANEEEYGLWDKTVGNLTRGAASIFSPLTVGEDLTIQDEKGNKTYLQSMAELRQQAIQNSYGNDFIGNVAKFGGDVLYGGGKMLGAAALDIPTAGIGGKSLYWTSMALDNYKQNINEGYSKDKSIANTVTNTAIQYISDRLLGGLTKVTTGGKVSELEKVIGNQLGKAVKDDITREFLAKIISEGTSESVEDLLGAIADYATLGKGTSIPELLKKMAYSFAVGGSTAGFVNASMSLPSLARGGFQSGSNNNNLNNTVFSDEQIREINEIVQQKESGQIDAEEANNRIAEVQNGTYQQNQNTQAVMQEAQRQFDAINQEEQTGQIDNQTAQQGRQAIINTIQDMQQPQVQQETQERVVQEKPEVESNESKTEKIDNQVIKAKNNVEVGKQYTYSNDGNNVRYEVKDIKDDGNVVIEIKSSNDPNLVGKKYTLKGDNKSLTNAQEYKSNIKYEDLSKDYSATRYDKKMYAKAKNTDMDMSEYDKTMEFINPNRAGNYSKQQILTLAEELGKKSKAKTGEELKQEAINYWVNKEPYKKTDSKTKYLKMEEFLKSYYKGAGVGQEIETTKEVKQEAKETPKVETKEKQNKVIQENNPMKDDIHTGIRNSNEIKTLEETLNDEDYEGSNQITPDLTRQDLEKAIEKGTITVYSSYPIEQGVFVSPSKMEAESYAGNGQIYSKEVPINDVAWIDPTQGQYAKIEENASNIKQDAKMQDNIAEKVEEPVIKVKENLPEKNTSFEEITFEKNNDVDNKPVDVLGEMPKKEKIKLTEKVKKYANDAKEVGSFLRRKFVDKMQSVDMLDRTNNRKDNLYAEADRTHRSVAEAQYSIGDGQIDSNGNEYTNFKNKDGSKGNKSLIDIFDEVEQNNMDMQEFNEYLIDYLNLDRYDKLTEDGKTKAPRGLDHTIEMSKENIKKFEEKHPEAKRIAENVWQYGYNELDTKVKEGLMTKQQAQNFMKETPHYVPISRDVEGYQSSLQKAGENSLSVNNQIKKIKGDSRETILPIREAMAWNTVLSRSSQRINAAIKAIAPYYNSADTDLSYSDSDLNINQDNVAVKSKDGKYYLTYYENGQAKTMQVEKGMYEAFTPEQVYEWEKVFKIPATIDSYRKKLITDYNIKFLKNNAVRDFQDALINTNYSKEFVPKYLDVVTRLKNNNPDSKMQQYINEFKKAGGFSETYFADREFTSQETKNPAKKALQALNKANEYIELTPRLTEYILSREHGESVSVALHNAADVTVNFARGGSWGKKMNKLGFTFLNPSIQGADKAIRNLDPRNPRRFASTVVRGALLGISAGVLNEMLWDNGDDDDKKEYENLNEYIKNNYYILPDKNGKPSVRIPKGRVMSVLQSIGRRGYNTYKGKGTFGENFKDLPSYAWGQVGPADPGNNNVFAPLFQAWSNKSWSGNPIDTNYEVNNVAPEERYSVKTTSMAKQLGKALKISPKRLDYVFDQYSGAIGDFVIPMTNQYAETSSDNKILEGLGAVFGNDMKVDPVFNNKQLGNMYDNLNKYNNLTSKEKKNYKNELGNKYLNQEAGKISKYNDKIKEIQASNKSNKEKMKETRKLQDKINKTAEKANNTYKNVKKEGDYAAKVGNLIYAKDNYGKWKKESDKTKEKRNALGLNVEDYYYYKKDEAFTKPDGKQTTLVDGDKAKENIALVDAFGFDPSDYLEYSYNISKIKEGKNTKRKVFEYINGLDISQEQKIMLMKKKYKSYRSYDGQLFNTINNSDLSLEEKESLKNFLKIGE